MAFAFLDTAGWYALNLRLGAPQTEEYDTFKSQKKNHNNNFIFNFKKKKLITYIYQDKFRIKVALAIKLIIEKEEKSDFTLTKIIIGQFLKRSSIIVYISALKW